MSRPRALVLTGYGLNCDHETAHVLELAGAQAVRVHISDLAGAPGHEPAFTLDSFQMLVLGGGFAWADDHGAGVILATRLRHRLENQLTDFIGRKGLILGICNGFQALVNLGLLPFGLADQGRHVALAHNDCGVFQDRWVEVINEPAGKSLLTAGLTRLDLPVRHGEGKLVASPETLARLEDEGLVALRYGNGRGAKAAGKFPLNPNGSSRDIAGLTDPSGRILGLMPHPEAFYCWSRHPDWTLKREQARRQGQALSGQDEAPGMIIFKNMVKVAGETSL